MICPNCKNEIENSSSACPVCGCTFNATPAQNAYAQPYAASKKNSAIAIQAWFVPVSIILAFIINHFLGKLELRARALATARFSIFSFSTSNFFAVIYTVVFLVLSISLFFAATAKLGSARKKLIPSAFAPFVFYILGAELGKAIGSFIYLTHFKSIIISILMFIIEFLFVLLFSAAAFFIVSIPMKRIIDNR